MLTEDIKEEIKQLLKQTKDTATAITTENCTTMESPKNDFSLKNDDESLFLHQNIEDRITNRDQRVKIAKKIFIMMVWEVSVVGFLLLLLYTKNYFFLLNIP